MAEEVSLEQQRALALARARLRAQQQATEAIPAPRQEGALDTLSQYAGVIGERLAPYATAAAGGAAVGGPVGAAVAPLALGLTDLAATGFNVGAQALGSEQRLPMASDVIRGGIRAVAPGVFREPETPGQRFAATTSEAATAALSQANALRQLATQAGPGVARNVLTEAGRAPVVQAGAAVPAAAAVQAVDELTDEDAILQDPYVKGAVGVLAGLVGGATTAKATRTGQVKAPTLDQMRNQAKAKYRSIDQSGVQFNPNAYVTWLAGVRNRLTGFDPEQHKAVDLEIRNLEKSANNALTISELDAARSNIKKRLGKSTDPNLRRLGSELASELDDFVLSAPQSAIIAGNYPQAQAALKEARRMYAAVSKSENMEELVRRAKLSGRPLDDAIRTEFRNLARNERRMRMYTPEERQFIEEVVQGGKLASALTSVSEALKVRSTLGGGLYAGSALGVFAPQVTLPMALAAGVGVGATRVGARSLANRLAQQRAAEASLRMRGGAPTEVPMGPIALGTATGLNNLSPAQRDFMAEQRRMTELGF